MWSFRRPKTKIKMHSWNINIAPKLGLTIISLIEVHMAMSKAHAENKEEEELVAQKLCRPKPLNIAKRCSTPSSQVSCRTGAHGHG